eukprot:XP_014779214.1 PREDICTED: uncharacterized protein LOC106875531 [Octopus bimaculoides]
MVFEGRNSNIENWFSITNLKSSPWHDLTPGNVPVFSLQGNNLNRYFYIGRFEGACEADRGWLVVIQGPRTCPYAVLQHYPSIFYASTDSQTTWASGPGVADSLAIFIRLIPN